MRETIHSSYHGLPLRGVVQKEQTYEGTEDHVSEIEIDLPDGKDLFEGLSHKEQAQVIGQLAEQAESIRRDRAAGYNRARTQCRALREEY